MSKRTTLMWVGVLLLLSLPLVASSSPERLVITIDGVAKQGEEIEFTIHAIDEDGRIIPINAKEVTVTSSAGEIEISGNSFSLSADNSGQMHEINARWRDVSGQAHIDIEAMPFAGRLGGIPQLVLVTIFIIAIMSVPMISSVLKMRKIPVQKRDSIFDDEEFVDA
ncbi:MAG TPA: hypothetical protein EYQ73_06310 [Candidatus Poseidoniales archaeon]|nr:MAG: hypothetical protein CXT71_03645 [Euryarchaeota archaeon]HIF46384.1 hypothetical protein [Candidatus Poseidoniales archaeon]HIL65263.1 hypothetical protein [Candidatus Poseidoniales archaeon]